MESRQEYAVRDAIVGRWRDLPDDARPPALWIGHHAPIPIGWRESFVVTPIQTAWFADRRGVCAESVWSYLRFRALHEEQPWCARMLRERTDVFGEPHRIAVAMFARYRGTAEYWVALSWGYRRGEGMRMSVGNEPDDLQVMGHLWIV